MPDVPSANPAPVLSDGASFGAEGSTLTDLNQQKVLTAAGLAAIGAAVGYTLYRASQSTAPQVLFRGEDLDGPRRVAFVNLGHCDQELAATALSAWCPRDCPVSLQAAFPSVTFFEESNECTVTALGDVVRASTLAAYSDLTHRRDNAPHCVVVYRSVITLDGDCVDLMESNARTLQRANGRLFRERHCLGFTADGRGVEVLVHDVVGQIDASRARGRWPDPADAEKLSVARLLRGCLVPTQSTLLQYTLGRVTHRLILFDDGMFGGMAVSSSADAASGKRLNIQPACAGGEAAADLLWRSPFQLFCDLAAVLCVGRDEWAGVQGLLVRQPDPVDAWSLTGIAAVISRAWRQSLAAESKSAVAARAPPAIPVPLTAHFFIVAAVSGTVGSAARAMLDRATADIVAFVLGKGAMANAERDASVRQDGAPALTAHIAAHGSDTCIVVDLSAVQSMCSVMHARSITSHLTSVLSALLLPIRRVALLAHGPSQELLSGISRLRAGPGVVNIINASANPAELAEALARITFNKTASKPGAVLSGHKDAQQSQSGIQLFCVTEVVVASHAYDALTMQGDSATEVYEPIVTTPSWTTGQAADIYC